MYEIKPITKRAHLIELGEVIKGLFPINSSLLLLHSHEANDIWPTALAAFQRVKIYGNP